MIITVCPLPVDPTPDRIIRDAFSDREDVIPFFRANLPPEIVSVLDLDSLEVVPGTFIDESMQEYRTDILFQIQTKSGSFTEIFTLFEHKSYPDPGIFTQLLSYLARIYERQRKPVPVLPFVFYHGTKGWTLGTEFSSHFRLTGTEQKLFGKYLPNFGFELFSLNDADIDSLNLTLYMQTLLGIMLHVDRGDLEEHLRRIFEVSITYFSGGKRLEKLRKLLLYVFARGEIPVEEVGSILASVSRELENEIMTTAQKLREEGIEQGIIQGEQELLGKQLAWRFGDLSPLEKETIQSCYSRELLDLASKAFAQGKNKHEVLDLLKKGGE